MTRVAANQSPAEIASAQALSEIQSCLRDSKSFLLEAGAGAGKTYSLVHTLTHILDKKGIDLVRQRQQVACITFTNVAANEIISRTDGHPAIFASTIHSFCWSLIRPFQKFMRLKLPSIEKYAELIEAGAVIQSQNVNYDLGIRRVTPELITLHHDDVIDLTIECLREKKFLQRMAVQFPIIFIDEYQDTNKEFINTIKTQILDSGTAPLIGFFGDHWQKIYGEGCGEIAHESLTKIGKKANFRSVPVIVNFLNKLRPDLPQHVSDPDATGEVVIYHSNGWTGQRRTENHWQEDLPPETAHSFLEKAKLQLKENGWDMSPEKTKILMLTHNLLADEQGYKNLAESFSFKDNFAKKNDPHISFFIDTMEPICDAFVSKKYGEMFSLLGTRTPILSSPSDKAAWSADMASLVNIRLNGTVGDVIEHLKQRKRPRLTGALEEKESKFSEWIVSTPREESRSMSELEKFKLVPYKEVLALRDFINGHTPFATKHGVKGAQFENVLVVFGRGWNLYNFNQFLEWFTNGVPTGKQDTYERNRNLFYVACSRPQKRLCLLFTQKLSPSALTTLQNWFGNESIVPLSIS